MIDMIEAEIREQVQEELTFMKPKGVMDMLRPRKGDNDG